jgi:predicted phosphoribosyltransferase
MVALSPPPFIAVGHYYEHFEEVTDDEVVRVMGTMTKR